MGRAGVCPEDGDSAVPETRAAAAAGPLAKALCHEESFALQWPRGELLSGSAETAEATSFREGQDRMWI